jgi:predicted ATP-binding protein involved in virulence
MKITKLHLENFRGYKSLDLPLDSKFNLIIGDNGSGKTALLEALTVAIGSFFLGITNVNSRSIYRRDIRIETFEHNEEYQIPVKVEANGIIDNREITWFRELLGMKNRTTTVDTEQIKRISKEYEVRVRNGKEVNLPLIAYYSTGRLFDNARNKEEDDSENSSKLIIASRFRGYDRCLEAKSTYKKFQSWFIGKEKSKLSRKIEDVNFNVVKNAIVNNLPDCKDIYFEFDKDKPQGIKVELIDGRILPFNALSDGTRNFLAIIADMAHKCVTLNPHLKEEALSSTKGIVLIDELDLHLHPEWQRRIVSVLRTTFPEIQFIASTHSPFLIQETGIDQLIVLKNNEVSKITSGANLSIEDIAEDLQDVINPQWSNSRQEMFEVATEYYKAVKEGKDTPEMKKKLDEAMKPFALDTAFYAIIEQEKIIQDYKMNKQ